MHVLLLAVGAEASVSSIRHTRVVDEPVVLAVAPAVVDVAVDVSEMAVIMTVEIGLEAIRSEGEEVVIRLVVRRSTAMIDDR